jgi:hypothetical protein
MLDILPEVPILGGLATYRGDWTRPKLVQLFGLTQKSGHSTLHSMVPFPRLPKLYPHFLDASISPGLPIGLSGEQSAHFVLTGTLTL